MACFYQYQEPKKMKEQHMVPCSNVALMQGWDGDLHFFDDYCPNGMTIRTLYPIVTNDGINCCKWRATFQWIDPERDYAGSKVQNFIETFNEIKPRNTNIRNFQLVILNQKERAYGCDYEVLRCGCDKLFPTKDEDKAHE